MIYTIFLLKQIYSHVSQSTISHILILKIYFVTHKHYMYITFNYRYSTNTDLNKLNEIIENEENWNLVFLKHVKIKYPRGIIKISLFMLPFVFEMDVKVHQMEIALDCQKLIKPVYVPVLTIFLDFPLLSQLGVSVHTLKLLQHSFL